MEKIGYSLFVFEQLSKCHLNMSVNIDLANVRFLS